MLGLSANLNYYLFNGNVDLRKGIFRLCEFIRTELQKNPGDTSNVYMFMAKNRKVIKSSITSADSMYFTKSALSWESLKSPYSMNYHAAIK